MCTAVVLIFLLLLCGLAHCSGVVSPSTAAASLGGGVVLEQPLLAVLASRAQRESVDLAIQLLNDSDYRGYRIYVELVSHQLQRGHVQYTSKTVSCSRMSCLLSALETGANCSRCVLCVL